MQGADVYIGVGANLGHRLLALDLAVRRLSEVGTRVVCSPVYETSPVGFREQPDFLNMVVRMETSLGPRQLLEAVGRVEQEAGRTREVRFGPRTLDLDILLYGTQYVCFRDLQIPHPRMWTRGFVLVPLADLAPARIGPGGRTVRELARAYGGEGGVR
ncbi:MAG: 2-amino-4-hydroxy-6-hydroxymethyldihydropteridine diphosphokinase, partial [Alicyclobacillus sp.]|nr:2-amino-4-hydroxy-6-hydroxymethyldihydropteridine diphosphokinase [Alicyclobacillus sp.]